MEQSQDGLRRVGGRIAPIEQDLAAEAKQVGQHGFESSYRPVVVDLEVDGSPGEQIGLHGVKALHPIHAETDPAVRGPARPHHVQDPLEVNFSIRHSGHEAVAQEIIHAVGVELAGDDVLRKEVFRFPLD